MGNTRSSITSEDGAQRPRESAGKPSSGSSVLSSLISHRSDAELPSTPNQSSNWKPGESGLNFEVKVLPRRRDLLAGRRHSGLAIPNPMAIRQPFARRLANFDLRKEIKLNFSRGHEKKASEDYCGR
ncbi:hypothetical protein TWF694_000170 [Orbilia ellipsospora]|uniref:Uncharacterized protein n=1 Tax=Orbilia ellipsospora TaxID=2528407 RepID=A0AAV9XUI0_9PEZI